MSTRRTFLGTGAAVCLANVGGAATTKPKLRKAVKYGMIRDGKTPAEKFALLKELGFDGVEMDSPSDVKVADAVKAAKETGIVIHGVVNSRHWQIRMSDPDPAVRGHAVTIMKGALEDAKKYGAETVLLVPGVVKDKTNENFDQAWERSRACVTECIPLAEKLGVKICIETVWNNFIVKVEQLNDYVDSFKNPIVGAYFDISNMLKYGMPSAEWIRRLGKRLYKFDFKGYSKSVAKEKGNEGAGFGVKIGDGDEDWPEVLKALEEVGYQGWATSEVAGGGRAELADIAARMDKVLGLKG